MNADNKQFIGMREKAARPAFVSRMTEGRTSSEVDLDRTTGRALHVEMDQAVALAYGWPILVNGQVIYPDPLPGSRFSLPAPLDLGHGFHATKQGERYTLSESARRTDLRHAPDHH